MILNTIYRRSTIKYITVDYFFPSVMSNYLGDVFIGIFLGFASKAQN